MRNYEEVLKIDPFSLKRTEKKIMIMEMLKDLSEYHYDNCLEYQRIIQALGVEFTQLQEVEEIPYLPVSLFKELDLYSTSKDEIFKIMTSSGTTGQAVSKIFLDRQTANFQQKTLVKIVSTFLGASRLPMLIIDSPSVIKDRKMFSARGAGILGFSIFGTDKTYALNEDMTVNIDVIFSFLQRHKDKPIFLFGFTFMVWQNFYKELLKLKCDVDLSKAILIHGGGWKKLANEAISCSEFKNSLKEFFGITKIHDYYGMVEQTGCIYMECEHGHLHASIFSDIIARRPEDFSVCKFGESGIIQVVSLIPRSYPGHSLLTEDEGIILGEDDCPCGRLGKYFKINGRIKNTEIRGCSDTYAVQF